MSVKKEKNKETAKIIEIGTVGKLVISQAIKDQIDFLHKKVGNKEWSGILVYKHIKGNIKKLQDLVFTVTGIFLMDIGSAASTEFDYTKDIVDMYDHLPSAVNENIGLIHTHHHMGAYHSSTDMNELKDNTENYNYYLSLVVDFAGDYKCKIGFPSTTKIKTESSIKDTKGNTVMFKSDTEAKEILLGNIEVEINERTPTIKDWFIERYEEINKPKPIKYSNYGMYGKGGYNGNTGYSYNGYYDKKSKSNSVGTAKTDNKKSENKTPDPVLTKYATQHFTQLEDFVMQILTLGKPIEKSTLRQAMNTIDTYNEADFAMYLQLVSKNIKDFHKDVYTDQQGSDYLYTYHLTRVVEKLEEYVHKDNIDALIIEINKEIISASV